MDTQQFEKVSVARPRKAHVGWWLGLGIVVALAIGLYFAYRPAPSTNAVITATESIAPATHDELASEAAAPRPVGRPILPPELVAMEAAGAINVARPLAVSRELVVMEAAGLVTLARAAALPSAAARGALPRELVEMEAAGLVTLAR